MIAYVDASVLLRVVLRQPNVVPEWTQIDRGVASALVVTSESLRTLDRLRLRAQLSDSELAVRRQAVLAGIASLELVEMTRPCWSAPLISCRQSLERFTQFTLPESCSGARVPAKNIATNGVDLNEPARSEANDDFAAKSALAKRLKGEERNGQPTGGFDYPPIVACELHILSVSPQKLDRSQMQCA